MPMRECVETNTQLYEKKFVQFLEFYLVHPV